MCARVRSGLLCSNICDVMCIELGWDKTRQRKMDGGKEKRKETSVD